MPPPFRVIAATSFLGVDKSPSFTSQKRDDSYIGVWSRPAVPLLVFRNHTLDGTKLSFHGGALAGAPGGHPLQLIFWGEWWNGPAGAAKRGAIISCTQAMLASPYFSQLDQYGIPHPPTWRGAMTVTRRALPASGLEYNKLTEEVLELIDELIDDDKVPDPDDGPRIVFAVLLPDGFTSDMGGAHWKAYDFDFPFDSDTYWAGWSLPYPVEPGPTSSYSTMSVLSHEIVEVLTDPECTAWHTEVKTAANEVSDAGFSPTAGGGAVLQAAFVNGVHVQSYWSNRHGAPIIPIDRDYGGQLRARVTEERRRRIQAGTFRPDPAESEACSSQLPECCFEDRDYAWRVFAVEEVARVRLETTRYREPEATWSINGSTVSGSGQVTLNLDVETFAGRTASIANRPVTLHFTATADGIDVRAPGVQGNFEINVSCSVRDLSITGDLLVDVIATPQLTVGFVGAELLLEDAYIEQKSSCLAAMLRRYLVEYERPLGKIRPEEGLNFDPEQLLRDLPAYVRLSQYQRLHTIAQAARAANATMEPGSARRFTTALLSEARALAQSSHFHVPSARRTMRAQARSEGHEEELG